MQTLLRDLKEYQTLAKYLVSLAGGGDG